MIDFRPGNFYNHFMSLSVNGIEKLNSVNLDIYSLYKIMTSSRLDDYQKLEFVRVNRVQIKHLMDREISNPEFFNMMQNRPLIKFRPIKNSYTKWGDKILLSKTLGILPSQVTEYVKNVTNAICDIKQMKNLPIEKIDSIKTYVYRHGSSEQVGIFLDYELKNSQDLIKTLKTTLSYGAGGVAEHYVRPIHRLTNKTMINLFNIIDDNLNVAETKGIINSGQKEQIAYEVLVRLYSIQQDQKKLFR